MPQTKFQDLTFTCIMVLIFVYVMTFYNAGLENGVTFATFGYALTHISHFTTRTRRLQPLEFRRFLRQTIEAYWTYAE